MRAVLVALALSAPSSSGCAEVQDALGLGQTADAGGAPRPTGGARSVQGIPVLAGAEVVFGGYLESDYQLELSIPGVALGDAASAYAGALRAEAWEGIQVVPEGLAQTLRAKRGARSLVARFEVTDAGVRAVILLSATPAATPSFAPVGDLEASDGGSADGGWAPPVPALPDGVPLPTGYRLVSNRTLVGGGWEVVFEVDASADDARGRLVRELVQIGWHFGGRPAARAPVSADVTDAPALGERSGVRVTITATDAPGPEGTPVATVRLTGLPVGE